MSVYALLNLPALCFCTPAMLGSKNIYGIAEVYEDDDCIIIKLKQLLKTQLLLHYCILVSR